MCIYAMKYKCSLVSLLLLIVCVCKTVHAEQFKLKQSEGGTLYLQIHSQVLDEVKFLLDTGSSLTLLTPETFNKLSANKVVDAGFVNARLANGHIKKVKTYLLAEFALSDACTFHDVRVAVLPRSNNILGMALLSKAGTLHISMNPPTLKIDNCDSTDTSVIPPV